MKTMVLVSDVGEYHSRTVAPSQFFETLLLTPHDLPQAGAHPIAIPSKFLPSGDRPHREKCWWRNELIYVMAVKELRLDADFFWCVESDVAAAPPVWGRLAEASRKRFLDGTYINLGRRDRRNGWAEWFAHPMTPTWATRCHLGAMFRLSRRAVEWLYESAEETREIFCEVANASTVHTCGGSTGDMNQLGPFYNRQTMRPSPNKCFVNLDRFNHPLKTNAPL